MADKAAERSVAQQIELIIRELDSLSTLACIGARCFSELAQGQGSVSALAEIIESDPVLTAKVLSVMRREGLSLSEEEFSIRRAVEKLRWDVVRDAIFLVGVCGDVENSAAVSRKELIVHSVAVACCAEAIAGSISPKVNVQLAYAAGLLHNIGNLALHQAMPKSFERIVEEAKSERASICAIEQKHLGLDYTILGKRLAQKWHLPNTITAAIWLHCSETARISADMPEARIAQIVGAADSIVRGCGIGESGSYDEPDSLEELSRLLAVYPEQLEQIRRELPGQAGEKSRVLGLNLLRPEAAYRDSLQGAAGRLAKENSKLSIENRRLQTASRHFDFIKEFLLSIDSNAAPVDIAEDFAVRWQKFYQTGMVCLYLVPRVCSQRLEAVVVESLARARIVLVNAPDDRAAMPEAIAKSFEILNAQEQIDWLFEQLDVEFELGQTKLMPLLSGGKAVGAIAFELRYPGDAGLYREQFREVTSFAGRVLDIAFASAERQHFAEQFVQLLSKHKEAQGDSGVESRPGEGQEVAVKDDVLAALAEMAAGAAHELNNPLSVISGRAQLLAGAETDSEKRHILEQIKENADELSSILDDVMAFARPEQPRPRETDVRQMVDEAIQLTSIKTNTEHINAQVGVAANVGSVLVDSGQVVSAIANVISNSVESYPDKNGPVEITAAGDESGGSVKLQISDAGCGMDAETLRKATWPFFCSRPAGRKRGMGLAHAVRLIQLNNGSLDITSAVGKGTTVTILLRRA